ALDLGEVGGDEPVEEDRGAGPLDGDQGPVVGLVRNRDVPARGQALEVRDDGVAVRGVRDDQVLVFALAVDEQVVDDAAGVVGQHAVLPAADLEPGGVVERGVGQERRGVRPGDPHLGHVGDVEDAGAGPHAPVLLVDAALVVEGHLVPGELHQPGAQLGVLEVERGAEHRREDITAPAALPDRPGVAVAALPVLWLGPAQAFCASFSSTIVATARSGSNTPLNSEATASKTWNLPSVLSTALTMSMGRA